MNMQELRAIAKKRGVKSSKLKKAELVQALQSSEGNEPCYESGKSTDCSQKECLWKDDCK